ncbi:heme/hemin ABC transporter substrate-binding protein [Sneathiella limimaris]|uniref:heme/hemin ABC transporter substrate-binding protein n=1 Tax=Sneathiella limimaris TaxID=1964213 RepID=UPI00146A9049|nr:hemin ABC transporter substrate-binding protein [Sneathiella limimaris]
MKKLLALALILLTPTFVHGEDLNRIISIGGSLTETVYALGQEAKLVGSDTTSYFPPAAEDLPKVGYMRTLSTEGVLSLKPGAVILTEEAGPPPVLAQLQAANVKLVKLKAAKSLDDVMGNNVELASLLGVPAKGAELNAQMTAALRNLEELKSKQKAAPRVMFLMNHGGAPMVAGKGTSADSIIELAGAENVVQDYERYKPLTPEAAVKYAPDYLIVSTSSLQSVGGIEKFLELPGLALTPAGQQKKVVDMDALLLLGFGPRTVDAAIELNRKLTAK